MSRLHKTRIVILVFIIFAVAVAFPILFGEPRIIKDQSGGDSWRNIIFDFQTLITGIAAVVAATLTIRTMEKTDAEAERRHRQLVSLNLRSDRLRVERMLFPSADELLAKYDSIFDVKMQVLKDLADDEPTSVSNVLAELRKDSDEAMKILKRKQFRDASDLFDGPLTYQYQQMSDLDLGLHNACTQAMDTCSTLFSALQRGYDHRVVVERENLRAGLKWVDSARDELLLTFHELLESLEAMAKEYKMD